jgi:hypothetical protein
VSSAAKYSKIDKASEQKEETFEINYYCAAIYLQIVLYSSEKDSARNKICAFMLALRCDQRKEI